MGKVPFKMLVNLPSDPNQSVILVGVKLVVFGAFTGNCIASKFHCTCYVVNWL